MDAIQFLKQEHQTAKAEFEKVLQASPKARGGLWQKLSPELEAHEQIEDACLYEPLSREAGGKDPKLAGWRQKHQDEVDEVEDLISEIESLAPESMEASRNTYRKRKARSSRESARCGTMLD